VGWTLRGSVPIRNAAAEHWAARERAAKSNVDTTPNLADKKVLRRNGRSALRNAFHTLVVAPAQIAYGRGAVRGGWTRNYSEVEAGLGSCGHEAQQCCAPTTAATPRCHPDRSGGIDRGYPSTQPRSMEPSPDYGVWQAFAAAARLRRRALQRQEGIATFPRPGKRGETEWLRGW
jgi:hypothetical protein